VFAWLALRQKSRPPARFFSNQAAEIASRTAPVAMPRAGIQTRHAEMSGKSLDVVMPLLRKDPRKMAGQYFLPPKNKIAIASPEAGQRGLTWFSISPANFNEP
jgi:hypothetical protein